MTATPTAEITRDDLESKLREIESVVDETTRSWSMLIIGGVAVAAAVVIGIGIMRARRQPPITVEVYHNE